MTPIEELVANASPLVRAEFERMIAIVRAHVPDPADGVSYSVPAIMHIGRPVIGFAETKRGLSIYPYSGKVIAKLADRLRDFETTSGSIHVSLSRPLPEKLLIEIVQERIAEIYLKGPRK